MLFIFDMGGVVTTTAAITAKIASILGMSEEQFLRFCGCPNGDCMYGKTDVKPDYDANRTDLLSMLSDGLIGAREFWSAFSQRAGVPVQTDWFHWVFHPVLNERTVSIVKALRKAGYRTVCGTNTMESHYLSHIERGDYAFFDQTYASNLMGVSKPDPRFWKIILTAEDALPKDCVFIDDKIQNCNAAAELGIKAVHFTGAEQLASCLGELTGLEL